MPKASHEDNEAQQVLLPAEYGKHPQGIDVDAVFNASPNEIAARAAESRNINEMDPELAELQKRNMEEGSGFDTRKAEKRVTQVRAGETAAEIASNGITRA